MTGIRDIHVVQADERTRVFPRDSLYRDVGARNEAEVCELDISPGDPIVPAAPFEILSGWAMRAGYMSRCVHKTHPLP